LIVVGSSPVLSIESFDNGDDDEKDQAKTATEAEGLLRVICIPALPLLVL